MPFPAVWSHSDDSTYAARPFFGANPYQVMKSGTLANVPIMIGFTKEDGLLITATLLKNPQLFQQLRLVFEDFLLSYHQFNGTNYAFTLNVRIYFVTQILSVRVESNICQCCYCKRKILFVCLLLATSIFIFYSFETFYHFFVGTTGHYVARPMFSAVTTAKYLRRPSTCPELFGTFTWVPKRTSKSV